MAKLKKTLKQQEALKTINYQMKILKKYQALLKRSVSSEVVVRSTPDGADKPLQLSLMLTEERVKKLIRETAQPMVTNIQMLASKCSIALDEEEEETLSFLKGMGMPAKGKADEDVLPIEEENNEFENTEVE